MVLGIAAVGRYQPFRGVPRAPRGLAAAYRDSGVLDHRPDSGAPGRRLAGAALGGAAGQAGGSCGPGRARRNGRVAAGNRAKRIGRSGASLQRNGTAGARTARRPHHFARWGFSRPAHAPRAYARGAGTAGGKADTQTHCPAGDGHRGNGPPDRTRAQSGARHRPGSCGRSRLAGLAHRVDRRYAAGRGERARDAPALPAKGAALGAAAGHRQSAGQCPAL